MHLLRYLILGLVLTAASCKSRSDENSATLASESAIGEGMQIVYFKFVGVSTSTSYGIPDESVVGDYTVRTICPDSLVHRTATTSKPVYCEDAVAIPTCFLKRLLPQALKLPNSMPKTWPDEVIGAIDLVAETAPQLLELSQFKCSGQDFNAKLKKVEMAAKPDFSNSAEFKAVSKTDADRISTLITTDSHRKNMQALQSTINGKLSAARAENAELIRKNEERLANIPTPAACVPAGEVCKSDDRCCLLDAGRYPLECRTPALWPLGDYRCRRRLFP